MLLKEWVLCSSWEMVLPTNTPYWPPGEKERVSWNLVIAEEGSKWKILPPLHLLTRTVTPSKLNGYRPLWVLLPRSPLTEGISGSSGKGDSSQWIRMLGQLLRASFLHMLEFPLLKQDNILQALVGSQWLTTLDALAGLTQMEIEPKEWEKLAFWTHHGLWQFV